MLVDTSCENSGFVSIIQDPKQYLFLDANFFIPPDRSRLPKVKGYSFESFKEIWLNPVFQVFENLAIHESVEHELVSDKVQDYVNKQLSSVSPRLKVFRNEELSKTEKLMMDDFITRLSIYSQYDPTHDCAKDRGEILTLSYMAVKKYNYLGAHDGLPIRLIQQHEKLDTGLGDMSVIQMYEVIYLLLKKGFDKAGLRNLYKYQYYLTTREKETNPSWDELNNGMEHLYGKYFD